MRLRKTQAGFGLVEILIGLIIAGALFGFMLRMNTRAEATTIGRARADQLASFQQLAAQFFAANRTSFQAAMAGDAAAAAQFCLINVAADGTGGVNTVNTTKRTCAFDSTLLKAKGLWPAGANVNITGVNRYVAISRQVMSADAVPVPTGADEFLVVLAQLDGTGAVMTSGTATFTGDVKQAIEETKAGMDALGGTGGYIPPGKDMGPCQYNATTKHVCGTGWIVSLADFL